MSHMPAGVQERKSPKTGTMGNEPGIPWVLYMGGLTLNLRVREALDTKKADEAFTASARELWP